MYAAPPGSRSLPRTKRLTWGLWDIAFLSSDRGIHACMPTVAATPRLPAAAACHRHSLRPLGESAFPSLSATSTGGPDRFTAAPIVGGSCGGGTAGWLGQTLPVPFALHLLRPLLVLTKSMHPLVRCLKCGRACFCLRRHAHCGGSRLLPLRFALACHLRSLACALCLLNTQVGRGAGARRLWAGVPRPRYADRGACGHQAAQPGAHPHRESPGADFCRCLLFPPALCAVQHSCCWVGN